MFVASKVVFAVFVLNVFLFMLYHCISMRMLAKQMVQIAEHLNEQLVFGHRMNRSMDTSFFVYKAYLEQSFDLVKIRVLTINHCLDLNIAYEGSIDGHRISLRPQPVEDSCPWQWAPGCLYNSYVLDGQANSVKYNSSYITLYRGEKKITIPLQRVPYKTKGAMAICVPPLYWYTNWAKMMFALELWKAQGVVHVIIYHHSSTKNVYKVLTHYQKESPFEDPNQSLYRLAHSLAHNDCVLRLSTEFGALIDVDEVIMPRNHTLVSFVIEKFANSSVGALLFMHRTLALNPSYAGQNFSYDTLDFSGIWDATELEYEGPPKTVFRTEKIDLLLTHGVKSFKSNFSIMELSIILKPFSVPVKYAALLHHRYNIGIDWIGRKPQSVRLLPTTAELNALHKSLNHRKEAIFPNGADFHFETQMELGLCLHRWRITQQECKTPISSCASVMLPLEEWHFAKDSNQYHIL